ncbi:MAG: proline dehydrogenase family protein [Bacteroidetes bacterium]|nr:proline dehydrogenase family protein [Bacteroidota bacterium]
MPKKLVWKFSKKYIAGETLQDAVDLVKKLNKKGILATLDVLGEAVTNKDEAIESKEEAKRVIDKIISENLEANLSIKPTQMGLSIDSDFAYEQISELVAKVEKVNNFIRIDMEDSPYTTLTFDLLKRLREKLIEVGYVNKPCKEYDKECGNCMFWDIFNKTLLPNKIG